MGANDTNRVGAGIEICYNLPPPQDSCETPKVPRPPDNASYGVGKNLGITVNANGSFCLNGGPSYSPLPGGIGWGLNPPGRVKW